jgi:hypothetical protein
MTEQVRWLDRLKSWIHLLPDLTLAESQLIHAINLFMGHDGVLYPSVATFSEVTGLDRRTVQRGLRKLVERGVLVVVERAESRFPTTYRFAPLAASGAGAKPRKASVQSRRKKEPGAAPVPPLGAAPESQVGAAPVPPKHTMQEHTKEHTTQKRAPPARVVSEKIQEAIPKLGTVHNPFALATAAKAFAANGGTMDDFDLLVEASRGPMLSKERRSSTERVAILIHWLANEDKWRVQIAESKSRFNMIEGRKKPVVAVPKSMDGLVVELMRGVR